MRSRCAIVRSLRPATESPRSTLNKSTLLSHPNQLMKIPLIEKETMPDRMESLLCQTTRSLLHRPYVHIPLSENHAPILLALRRIQLHVIDSWIVPSSRRTINIKMPWNVITVFAMIRDHDFDLTWSTLVWIPCWYPIIIISSSLPHQWKMFTHWHPLCPGAQYGCPED